MTLAMYTFDSVRAANLASLSVHTVPAILLILKMTCFQYRSSRHIPMVHESTRRWKLIQNTPFRVIYRTARGMNSRGKKGTRIVHERFRIGASEACYQRGKHRRLDGDALDEKNGD